MTTTNVVARVCSVTSNSMTYTVTGLAVPSIVVRHEGETWWASCPACPGFTAAADSWSVLYRLVSGFHRRPDAVHRDWVMIQIYEVKS